MSSWPAADLRWGELPEKFCGEVERDPSGKGDPGNENRGDQIGEHFFQGNIQELSARGPKVLVHIKKLIFDTFNEKAVSTNSEFF